jgi:hypothetical protein
MARPRIRIWLLMVCIALLAPPIIHLSLMLRSYADTKRASRLSRAKFHLQLAISTKDGAELNRRLIDLAKRCDCRTIGEWDQEVDRMIPGEGSRGLPPDKDAYDARKRIPFEPDKQIKSFALQRGELERLSAYHSAMSKKYIRLAERFWERVPTDPPTPKSQLHKWDFPPAVE